MRNPINSVIERFKYPTKVGDTTNATETKEAVRDGVSRLGVLAFSTLAALAACDATPPSTSPNDASVSGDVKVGNNDQSSTEGRELFRDASRPTFSLVPPRQYVNSTTEESVRLRGYFEDLEDQDSLDALKGEEQVDRLMFESENTAQSGNQTWEKWLEKTTNSSQVEQGLASSEILQVIHDINQRKGIEGAEITKTDVVLAEFELKKLYFVEKIGKDHPRAQLVQKIWDEAEDHYVTRPSDEAQRKAAALDALLPNWYALTLLGLDEIQGTGGKKLKRVTDPGDLQPGDLVERHNPCLEGKAGFTMTEDGRYVDSNNTVYSKDEISSLCADYDVYFYERPAKEVESEGDEGVNEGEPYWTLGLTYDPALILLGNNFSNENHLMLSQAFMLHMGRINGGLAWTLGAGAETTSGRLDTWRDADEVGQDKRTSVNGQLGFEVHPRGFKLDLRRVVIDPYFRLQATGTVSLYRARLAGNAGVFFGLNICSPGDVGVCLNIAPGIDMGALGGDHGRPQLETNNRRVVTPRAAARIGVGVRF